MAQWLGCWTRDKKVWSSIPTVGHVYKCRANFSFHNASAHLAVMGIWWNEKWSTVSGISCKKYAEFSPEEMKTYL